MYRLCELRPDYSYPHCGGYSCRCLRPYGFRWGGNRICQYYGPMFASVDDMIKYDFREKYKYRLPLSLEQRLHRWVKHVLAKKTAMRDLEMTFSC